MKERKNLYLSELLDGDFSHSVSKVKEALLSGKNIVIPEFGEMKLCWRHSKNGSMAEQQITPKISVILNSYFREEALDGIGKLIADAKTLSVSETP